MPVIKCPGCGSTFSAKAPACPRCGYVVNGNLSPSNPPQQPRQQSYPQQPRQQSYPQQPRQQSYPQQSYPQQSYPQQPRQQNEPQQQSYQPNYPSSSDTQLVSCPECGELSDSIKNYDLPYRYLFLYVYASTQDIEYTCCPRCMRKHILYRGFTYNILTFNVLWPFWIFPWMIIQLIRSFTRGHSKSVKEALNRN